MFVGKDVATALGYSNTSKAIQQHVDHEDKGILPIRETAYETRAVVINESGLYSLILSSKLPRLQAVGDLRGTPLYSQDRPLRVATAAPCAGPAQRGCREHADGDAGGEDL